MKFSSSSRDWDVRARQSLCLRGLSEYPQSGRSGGRSWCRTWCSSDVMQSNSLSSMLDTTGRLKKSKLLTQYNSLLFLSHPVVHQCYGGQEDRNYSELLCMKAAIRCRSNDDDINPNTPYSSLAMMTDL